ncbi:thiol peroxidase [Sporolituus thermophilus]|uniref:Thiol peroxidase n=1 Tax=Sporolituus thermophilus DSM 23256 TaxID=1123285 RepID=A0A1G7ICE6_9FIRM|nr:thiol peroxidase [Sporolituus thermophilus]SDF10427.1 thiol peroxidase (atypical 2-Cys peroxiredoxin) [Sporolituus thermophilus DSM 23256]
MEKRKNVITFKGNPLTLLGPEIKTGMKAPDFTVLSTALEPVKLSDHQGKVRIISVVPSVDTPVCDMQTRRFNEEASELSDAVVFSVSVDLPFALAKYCAAQGIDNIKTLSDHKDLDFGLKYGFVIEELRLLARGIIVVDKEGIVRHVEYVKEVTEHPDYAKALAVAKEYL